MAQYFSKLESLRGLAAIAVVVYHSPFYKLGDINQFVSNSYLFVDFFFILSGFVMASAYQKRIGEGFSLRDYFWLRLGRIYPLHLFFLMIWGVYILIKWNLFNNQIELTNPLVKNTFESFVTNLFLIHSLSIHNYTNWNFPSWSISVEFFTYFIFFVFALIFKRLQKPLIAISALAIAFTCYFYVFDSAGWTTIDFTVTKGIYRCCGGFFLGVFLFQISSKLNKTNVYVINALEILAVASVIFVVSNASVNSAFLFSVIPVFAFAIFVFSRENDGVWGKFLQLKPFADAGKYSYSIYLSHAIILDFAFSFAQYFWIQPKEVIYYYQSDYSYLINICLILLIGGISALSYTVIEKRWIEKSKHFVVEMNEIDEIERKKVSIFSLD